MILPRLPRTLVLVLALAPLAAWPLLAEGIDDARAAAVFIQVKGTKMGGTGTGFVVARTQDNLYIVTNEHVVTMQTGRTGFDLRGVFHSGTSRETTKKLDLLAVDRAHDLALLRVPTFAGAPKPILLDHSLEPKVGQRLAIIGFPFGTDLDLRAKNPVVATTRATVSQPFHNRFGLQPAIELTGSANPGNSGGPVVDAKGRLTGVLVAGYNVGQAIQIIPADLVRDLWKGVFVCCDAKLRSGYGLTARFDVTYMAADPFHKVTAARLVVLPAGKLPPTADRGAFHRLAAKHLSLPIPAERQAPGAPAKVALTLTAPGTGQGDFAIAIQTTREDGTVCLGAPVFFRAEEFVEPRPLSLDTREADRILGTAQTVSKLADPTTAYAHSIGKAGTTPVLELPAKAGLRILSPLFEAGMLTVPCWLKQGAEAVVVDADGWLVKIALPSFDRVQACQLVWPKPTGIRAMREGIEVASRQALVRSRSHLLLLSRSGEQTGCVHVIKPETLEVIDFLSLPGAVALSAVPESDRVLVRYADGELALLVPETGQLETLCRPRGARGLRVAGGKRPTTTLPARSIADAVLVSPGKHVLVLADAKVFALELREPGIRPVDADTPTWDACASIHYQPGSTMAVLGPVGAGATARLVDLQSLKASEMPRSGPRACLDPTAATLVELQDSKPWPVLNCQSLKGEQAESYAWPAPNTSPSDVVLTAHPRGGCYWLDQKGAVFWAEVGQRWGTTSEPARPSIPVQVADVDARDLGQNADLRIRELALSARTVSGACWTRDGTHVLAAWSDGTVRRMDPWALQVAAKTELGQPCTALSASQCGPVATLSTDDGTQLVVLDERSVTSVRRIDMPPCTVLATGVRTPLGVAAIRNVGLGYVDLRSGKLANPLAACALPGGGGTLDLRVLEAVALAPDGSRVYLLAKGRLVSWSLRKGKRKVDVVLGGSEAPGGIHRIIDMSFSADGLFVDLTIQGQNGKRRHEVRSAVDLRTVYRRFDGDPQVVFDCGARRLLYTGETPRETYPFASGPQDSLALGWVQNTVSFTCGPRVLPHPGGNHLVAFGERIHALHYTSEASQ